METLGPFPVLAALFGLLHCHLSTQSTRRWCHSLVSARKGTEVPATPFLTDAAGHGLFARSGHKEGSGVLRSGVIWNHIARPIVGLASELPRQILRQAELILGFFKMPIKQNRKISSALKDDGFVCADSRMLNICSLQKWTSVILYNLDFPANST